jgi:hypothetical protein
MNSEHEQGELQVHALFSKGAGKDAQTLLVLGSWLPKGPEHAVWIRLGSLGPISPLFSANFWFDDVEPTRPLIESDWLMLGVDSVEQRRELEAKYPLLEGHHRWMARCDFSDHPRFAYEWSLLSEKKQGPIELTAWCAQRGRASHESTKDALAAYLLDGTPLKKTFDFGDVQTQRLFELGILFVHGIGPHRDRETLIRFGEPLIDVWLGIFRAMLNRSAQQLGEVRATELHHRLHLKALSARQDLDGMPRMVQRLASAAAKCKGLEVDDGTQLAVAWLRAEDTLLPSKAGDEPAATVMRLMRAHKTGDIHDSHALMAEAWWVRDSIQPTYAELRTWIREALPATLMAHSASLLGQASSWRQGNKILTAFFLLECGVKLVVLPPVYMAIALLAQVILLPIGLLGVLPLPFVQKASRGIIGAMMGTLGHSHALQTSPIRRNAIVQRVSNQLDWLRGRCHRVAVIAHSQGAEVTRLLFQQRNQPEVTRWVTFGSGIAPLNLLERANTAGDSPRMLHGCMKICSVLMMVCLLSWFSAAWPGLLPMELGEWIRRIWLPLFFWALLFFFALSWLVLLRSTVLHFIKRDPPRVRPSVLPLWRNYYASRDPVPGGALLDGGRRKREKQKLPAEKQASEIETHNTRFGLTDHTSYFDNVEQFVAPVAVDLLAQSGLLPETDAHRAALFAASHRRAEYTLHHHWVRSALVLATLVVLSGYFMGWGSLSEHWQSISLAVGNTDSWFAAVSAAWRTSSLGQLLQPLWPLLLIGSVHWVSLLVLRERQKRSLKQLFDDLAAAHLNDSRSSPAG